VSTSQETVAPIFSPDFLRNPYPTYRQHLDGPSVQRMQIRSDLWAVFRYDTCMSVLRELRMSSVRPVQSMIAVPEEERTEFASFISHAQRWLLFLDAPAHTRLRKLMNRGFAPLTIEKLRPRVEAAVEELLRKAASVPEFDLIADFAYPLPVRIISELLGLPPRLYDRCIALSTDIANWLGNLRRTADDARRASAAVAELTGYFADVIREREGAQQEDLLHLLLSIAATEPGITVEDVHSQCVLLLVAGHETTRNLIGNGMYTLLTHPEALDEVRAQPEIMPAVVEEILRFESPVQAFGRFAATDMEIDGVALPAGSSLTLVIGAAHRDSHHFENPDRFDIHRKRNRHLAFGADAHVCLGTTLARLEGQLGLAALIERFPRLRLASASPDWGTNFAFRGLRSLPVLA
jgi:pimeloyl-[acyl-carrier protein] synthase